MVPVDVVITAWPNHPRRIDYFRQTWAALQEKLTASHHSLRFHVSAESERDPDHPWHGDELQSMADTEGFDLRWREGPASLGANMNAALRLATAPTIFLVQDDWLLLEPLDLSPGIDFLVATPTVELLRYSWPGDLPTFIPNIDGWRRIALDGMWPYGDNPHLRRSNFGNRFGWYLEGGRHGRSEGEMLYRLVRLGTGIAVADRNYFDHIGQVASVVNEYRPREILR